MPDEEIRTATEITTDLEAVNNAHYAEVMPSWVNVERMKYDFIFTTLLLPFKLNKL